MGRDRRRPARRWCAHPLGQWSTLLYQTSRQKRARKADFQRTTLLAIRDLLGEVNDALGRIRRARWESQALRNEWDYASTRADVEALQGLTYRLRLLATSIEHEDLRGAVEFVHHWSSLEADAMSEEDADDARKWVIEYQIKAVRLLGEQLRALD